MCFVWRICFAAALILTTVNPECTDVDSMVNCDTIDDIQQHGTSKWSEVIVQKSGRRRFDEPDKVISNKAFEKVGKIKEISIFKQLTDVEAYTFKNLNDLEKIKLRHNKLTVLKANAFSGIQYLDVLDLEENNIENIVHGTFSRSNILSIDLSNNKINNIQEGQLNLESLEKLNLQGNFINFFANKSFHRNLQVLILANCNLTDIPVDAIIHLRDLKELNLSKNHITNVVSPSALPELRKLDLSRNNIITLPEYAFRDNKLLTHLYIGYNKIARIEEHWFPISNSLRVFHFQKNLVTGLSQSLGKKWRNLKEVSINSNPWPCDCLKHVKRYIDLHNITQPICEIEMFDSGILPVCVSEKSTSCDSSIFVDSSLLQSFLNITRNTNC